MWYRYRGGGPTTRDGVMILFDELNPRRGPCRIRKAGTEVIVIDCPNAGGEQERFVRSKARAAGRWIRSTMASARRPLPYERDSKHRKAGSGARPQGAMSTVARQSGTLLLWTGVVVFLTWPLAAHLTDHLPGIAIGVPFDSLMLGWALAHQSHALLTAPCSLPDGNIYWPSPRALYYGEAGFGALPYFMPPFLATGNPTLALNLLLLVGLVLTAWSMHRVVARLAGSERAGFVAGAVLITAPWVIWAWVPAAPSYAILQYFPVVMLIAARPSRRVGTAACLLLLVVVQGLTSVYVAAPLLAPLVVLGLARLARQQTRRAGVALLGSVAGATVVLAAAYSGYVLVRLDNPELATQTFWPAKPTDPQPAGLGTAARLGPLAVPPVALIVIGLGLVGAIASRERGWSSSRALPWRIGWLWTLVGLVIAIRPRADWHESLITAPHSLLARFTPFYEVIRMPERLGLAALMGVAVLTGVAFAECERVIAGGATVPRPRRAAGAATLGLLLVTVGAMYCTCQRGLQSAWLTLWPLPGPYPLAPTIAPPAPALMRLVEQPGGPLLELPVGRAWSQARAMYRSIYHHRPLLNGYSGYWPAGFPERMALARRLPDPEALDALRRATDLELVLVHAAEYGNIPARATWMALAGRGTDGRLALVARDGDDLLFRVVAPCAAR